MGVGWLSSLSTLPKAAHEANKWEGWCRDPGLLGTIELLFSFPASGMLTEATLLNCFWSMWQVLMLFKTLGGFSLVVASLHSSIWFLKTARHTSFGTEFGGWVSWMNTTFWAALAWLPHGVWRISKRNPLCALSKVKSPGTSTPESPKNRTHWLPCTHRSLNVLLPYSKYIVRKCLSPSSACDLAWEYMPWKALLSTLLASHSQAF